MFCLSVYLIQIKSYSAFSNMAVDHWCLSLRSLGVPQKEGEGFCPPGVSPPSTPDHMPTFR